METEHVLQTEVVGRPRIEIFRRDGAGQARLVEWDLQLERGHQCRGGPRECCGDRAEGPHEANLFDIDAKYGDFAPISCDPLVTPTGCAQVSPGLFGYDASGQRLSGGRANMTNRQSDKYPPERALFGCVEIVEQPPGVGCQATFLAVEERHRLPGHGRGDQRVRRR